MNGRAGFQDSYVAGNGYQFHCPVVDRDTMIIACWFMRMKFMKGKEFAAHDCRCAMSGSKCPAMRMLDMEWREGKRLFFDSEPRAHELPEVVLDAIDKVLLVPSQQGRFPVTPEQAERLFGNKLNKTRVKELIATEAKPRARKAKTTGDAMLDDMTSTTDLTSMVNQALVAEREHDSREGE